MAQVQEYYDPGALYPSPPQPQSRFTYPFDTSTPLGNYEDVTQDTSMAQPLLQRPFKPEEHIQPSQWPMSQWSLSQQCIQPTMPGSSMRAQDQLWRQHPAFGNSMTWAESPTEPLVVLETDNSMLANGDWLYSQTARQNALSRTGMYFDGTSVWPLGGMNNLRNTNTVPSPEEDILLSPVSPFSDAKHTYSPGPGGDQMTPIRGSASYPIGTKVSSSPGFVSATLQSGSMLPYQPGCAAIHNGFELAIPPAGEFQLGSAVEPASNATTSSSEHSYAHSQSSSPGETPWYPPGYRVEKSALIQDAPNQQLTTQPNDGGPKSSMTFIDSSMRQRQPQWSNKSSGVPAQGHFETRFMVPSTAGEKAQRASDDGILLQMKQDGFTYKDIRKALRQRVAESTLRGRYRALTKPRKMRVRAPKWTEIDIMLLKRYVQEEFEKLDVTHPSLETKQKPDKIPWMKVVETIAATGGTYKFGAATAKKKWVEITRSAAVRSSRRRAEA